MKAGFDLGERLLNYGASVIRICNQLLPSRAGQHVADQLLRAGTSPLFNHGEADAAESPADFVHKMSICLKELRESRRALQLIRRVPLIDKLDPVDDLLAETEELIRIFYTSIRTARSKVVREPGVDYGTQASTEAPG